MTDTNVAALFGGPSPDDPVPAIVEALEALLVDARTGELRGLAFATVKRNRGGAIGSGWARGGDDKGFDLAAAIMRLNVIYANELALPD